MTDKSPMTQPLLEIRDLRVAYPGRGLKRTPIEILHGVSLDVRAGDVDRLWGAGPLSFQESEQALLLGHQTHPTPKSRGEMSAAERARYSPETAGYIGFGDQTGAKQSTAKTLLADAIANGADVMVRCFVERVLVENGRAAGVEGRYEDPDTCRSARA